MGKIKKLKLLLSLLLVALIAVSVVTVTGVLDINKLVSGSSDDYELPDIYDSIFSTDTTVNSPLLKTDIADVYYSMDTLGDVRFFKLSGGSLTEIEETGSFDVKASCSGQEIPATIHYIEYEGRTQGFGLFTNTLYEGVYLYDYAFFKVTDMFKAFSGESDLLMMLDVEKSRFYSDDKVFSEIFYLYSSHNSEHFLSENQRIVGMDARLRTDYKMFTSEIASQGSNKILFFSSRFYTALDDSGKIDIMSSGGSGENIDNVRYITDVAALKLWKTDEGTRYFADNGDGTFSLMLFDGSESSEIACFDGDINEDYVFSGRFMLNLATGEIYNCVKDKTVTLSYNDLRKDFAPDMFTVSANGKYCVFRGADTRGKPVFGVGDLTDGSTVSWEEDVFGYAASIEISNDGTAVATIATDENGSSYYQLLYNAANAAETGAADENG